MKKSILLTLLLPLAATGVHAQNITAHGTVLSKTDDRTIDRCVSLFRDYQNQAPPRTSTANSTLSVPEGSKLTDILQGRLCHDHSRSRGRTYRLSSREDSEILDEVVVVGYSSENKSDLTGSVSVVKMKDVSDTPTGNVIQALQGRVARHQHHNRRHTRRSQHRHFHPRCVLIPRRGKRPSLCD